MSSLRRRMMRVLCLTIGICWALTLGLFLYTQLTSRSSWDSKLQTIATKLLLSIPQGDGISQLTGPGLRLRDSELADTGDLTFQVWAGRDHLVVRAPGAPASALRADFQDGFSSPQVAGQRWRVYSISDSTGHIFVQVGNLHSVIDAEIRRKTFSALIIITTLLTLLGLFMWQVLARALLPVFEIEKALRERHRLDLTPLPVVALPRELQPLVEAFNHLLGQLDQALEGERRFIGNAAHELRTPLAALQAHAQIALRATTLAEKDATLLKLQAVAARSTRLSEQLLDLARLDASNLGLHRVQADLGKLIGYVADEFAVQAVQQQRTMQLCTQPCLIDCDIDEIGILLRNLIDNALRYTAPGDSVKISCGFSAQEVYLQVADNGPGVPIVEREIIFDRFHRVSGNGGRGSGIGLSLVKSIAQGHKARIQTGEGPEGRGLTITVLFPPAIVAQSQPPAPGS